MPRPAYDSNERRAIEANICAKAVDLFALKGYRNVSLRAIAGELDLSAPALYRYYENKEALLAAVRAAGFTEIHRVLADVRARATSPLAAPGDAIKAYLDFATRRRELYQLMYELDQGAFASTPEVHEKRGLAFSEAIGIAQDMLDYLGIQGDSVELAHIFWINAHGLAALTVANQLDLGKRFDELVDPLVDTLTQGILKET